MKRLIAVTLAGLGFVMAAGPANAADSDDPGGSFIDDDDGYYEGSIEAIFAAGITFGCSDRQEFCPDRAVTRGELAAFISRTLQLPATSEDFFSDDDSNIFEGAINRIAAAGITSGCNPPGNDRFCPDRTVTRAELATLFVRAFSLAETTLENRFIDDDDSVHEKNIDRLAAAKITVGCNPPDNDEYCPDNTLTRGQTAVFLTRAIPLEAMTPPPRPPSHLVSRFTTYHACCQARVENIQTMARALDGWIVLPWETFDLNAVVGPRTEAKGYVPAPILLNGEGYCCDHPLNIGGGTSQFATTIYNTIFWGAYDEVSHRPHSRYIDRYPLGIEATLGSSSPNIVFVNDTWTPVIVDTSYTSTSITVSFWGNNGDRTMIGSHRYGRTNMSVTKSGDDTARVVTARVIGSATYDDGGAVSVERTIAGPNGTTTETWNHWYIGSTPN